MKPIAFRLPEESQKILNTIADQHFGGNKTKAIIEALNKFKWTLEDKYNEANATVKYSSENMAIILVNPFWKNDPQFVINSLVRREAVRTEDVQVSQRKVGYAGGAVRLKGQAIAKQDEWTVDATESQDPDDYEVIEQPK